MHKLVYNYQAKCYDTQTRIKNLISKYKEDRCLKMSLEKREAIKDLIKEAAHLDINLNNPILTPVESIIIGFSSIFNYEEIGYMLGLRRSTIKTYESRSKEKLNALSKLHAICLAMQHEIFSIK